MKLEASKMRNVTSRDIGRQHLDQRLSSVSDEILSTRLARPQKGWIRAIREALGMSSAQLARRVGVKQSVLYNIETSEIAGTAKLQTLQRVAAALNCHLVYALVPNEPLETMVRNRVREVIGQHLGAVEHSMRLEDQAIDDRRVRDRQLDLLKSEIDMRRLWD